MGYSSAVLFAALVVCGSASPAFACRGENSATIVQQPTDRRLVKAGTDQYNVKVDAGAYQAFELVVEPSRNLGFCVDLPVPDSADARVGVFFWGSTTDPNDMYYVLISDDKYMVRRSLFGQAYTLVPSTTDVSIKKGRGQKNEVDVRVTATGVDIQINGAQLTSIVARPLADAQRYGVALGAPKAAAATFQVGSPRIVKWEGN